MQPTGKKIYSVSEITHEIKALLEGRFPGVWVEGEISNIRKPGSGHVYFTLKDEGSQLQAVLYRSHLSRSRFDLKDGLQVIAFGDVSVYAKGGRYQLTIAEIEPKGLGALQLAFEQLKQRLAREGLFAPERKKPIPLLPERIGIVTSPTGAAIRDILTVIDRRFANVRILISPVRVQGETAAGEIAAAIDGFNSRADVDVIIVTRGGGSLEDLWAFNEEAVARAIAGSRIPVISAVGHEIDFTISDFVADLRVPTPSAAAELVIAKKSELQGKLEVLSSKMSAGIGNRMTSLRNRLRLCRRSYVFQTPRNMVRQHQQSLDELDSRLRRSFLRKIELVRNRLRLCRQSYVFQTPRNMARRHRQSLDELDSRLRRSFLHKVELTRNRLGAVAGKLESLSPLAVLSRGYSVVVRERDGAVVSAYDQVARGDVVSARLHRGGFTAEVKEAREG